MEAGGYQGVVRTFYRILAEPSATRRDFLSNRALGRVLRRVTPETRRTYDGVSVFETFAQARAAAIRFPMLGSYIAELVIPEDAAIHIERTFANQPGHHTMWGNPDEMLGYVERIHAISDGEQNDENHL